jgi:hypothetical protein
LADGRPVLRAPTLWQWWSIVVAALAIVVMWPPVDGKSLAVTFVNWAVDPSGQLPILPSQLPLGKGDDPEAVEARDSVVRQYDALHSQGGWTRRRLLLKVAGEPLRPSTMRQLLMGAAVILALVTWRVAVRTPPASS